MFRILLIILKRKKYFLIALLATIVMAGISYYLTVYNIRHKSILLYADMNGGLFTIASLTLGLMISLLFGAYFSLFMFKRDSARQRSAKDKSAGVGGTIIGLLASGCPSCGAPLLGLMGFPLGLFSLPLRGLGLKILSIALMLLSIYFINRSIKGGLVCERPTKH